MAFRFGYNSETNMDFVGKSGWAAIIFLTLFFGMHVFESREASAQTAGSVTYCYDALGRVTRAIYSTGLAILYSYDAAGNRTSVVTSNTVTACS
jgi:YD repeat-containing protein